MIRESNIDAAINRLSDHFGTHLRARPPASAEELAQLEQVVGLLPREFTIFLSTCNGLRIDGTPLDFRLQLWNAHEMISSIVAAPGPDVPQGLVPFCGDHTGERDWLIVGHGPAGGAVLRWDPWLRGTELVASCFGSYFDAWAHYVTQWYDSAGKPLCDPSDRPVFDARYAAEFDDRLLQIANDTQVRQWLFEIDQAVSCEDYE